MKQEFTLFTTSGTIAGVATLYPEGNVSVRWANGDYELFATLDVLFGMRGVDTLHRNSNRLHTPETGGAEKRRW